MRFTDILMSSAHAFIIEGNSENREFFRKRFVKALNCECDDIEKRPCNKCKACIQIEAGTSMDVIYMEKSGKELYTVKDASRFIERLNMGSYGEHVVGVIEDADSLSEHIQNKMLKTLEEPAPGVIIIIETSNADKMILTVKSRCNVIKVSNFVDMGKVMNEEIEEELESFFQNKSFYELRKIIERKIKSKELAIYFLGRMEDKISEKVFSENALEKICNIDIIEATRKDIFDGMNFAKALKRMCLELA